LTTTEIGHLVGLSMTALWYVLCMAAYDRFVRTGVPPTRAASTAVTLFGIGVAFGIRVVV